jgi:hypothetical protein
MCLEFGLVLKIKLLLAFDRNQGNWLVWPDKCEYLARLRHS